MSIFSLGHSNHTNEKFLSLVKVANPHEVWDVRSYPRSKWSPHFNTEFLKQSLAAIGVGYRWVKELGGLDKQINPEDYKRELEKLISESKEKNIVIICSEHDHHDCHRFNKISKNLEKDYGILPLHITRDGVAITEPHPDLVPPTPSLF